MEAMPKANKRADKRDDARHHSLSASGASVPRANDWQQQCRMFLRAIRYSATVADPKRLHPYFAASRKMVREEYGELPLAVRSLLLKRQFVKLMAVRDRRKHIDTVMAAERTPEAMALHTRVERSVYEQLSPELNPKHGNYFDPAQWRFDNDLLKAAKPDLMLTYIVGAMCDQEEGAPASRVASLVAELRQG